MAYTYDELSKRLETLPEDLKDAIFGTESSQALQEISKKYGLHIDKLGELVNETGLVMVGLTHPKNFIGNLARRLGIDRETAKKIAEDVNKQIFAKVRESLRKIHGIEEESKVRSEELTVPETRSVKQEIKEASSPKPQDSKPSPLEIRPVSGAKTPEKSPIPDNAAWKETIPQKRIQEQKFSEIKKDIKEGGFGEIPKFKGMPSPGAIKTEPPPKPEEKQAPPPAPKLPSSKGPDPYREEVS